MFGRYVMNDTPTWAEALALVLVLYVPLFGAAVGVRDAGHIGMESLLVLVPEKWRLRLEIVIHVLVGAFGALMAWNGAMLAHLGHATYKIPTLGIPEGCALRAARDCRRADPRCSAIEHIVAHVQRTEVVPAWL